MLLLPFKSTQVSVFVPLAKDLLNRNGLGTITVIGNETGGATTINLTVNQITAVQAQSA